MLGRKGSVLWLAGPCSIVLWLTAAFPSEGSGCPSPRRQSSLAWGASASRRWPAALTLWPCRVPHPTEAPDTGTSSAELHANAKVIPIWLFAGRDSEKPGTQYSLDLANSFEDPGGQYGGGIGTGEGSGLCTD